MIVKSRGCTLAKTLISNCGMLALSEFEILRGMDNNPVQPEAAQDDTYNLEEITKTKPGI
ncbi:hypothetical protein ACKGJO_05010 [Gracilimonas sp. Q87]|uniref:hypothetical protein n=1 Tax=Gracilimonas sp. Q87 TaxID=3384766 RepID=UPI0039844DB9